MKTFKYIAAAGLVFAALLLWLEPSTVQAAGETASGSGGYLAGYQDADPRPTQSSWWSTLAYLVSLVAVFAFVLGMAYVASRFLGGRFAQGNAGTSGRVIENLPLGPNRSVCVVDVGGKVLLLGVAEHAITLLQEITDAAEIERLRARQIPALPAAGLERLLAQQFNSLDKISRRIPTMFKEGRDRK